MSIKSLRRRVDKLCPSQPSDSDTITRDERMQAFFLRRKLDTEGLTPAEQEEFVVLSTKMDAEAKANNRTEWIDLFQDACDMFAAIVEKYRREED